MSIAMSMSHGHIRAMMGPQGLGYRAALRVLDARRARGEYYTYLEELRREQLTAERLAATSEEEVVDERCKPGCGVCVILLRAAKVTQQKKQRRFTLKEGYGSEFDECYHFDSEYYREPGLDALDVSDPWSSDFEPEEKGTPFQALLDLKDTFNSRYHAR